VSSVRRQRDVRRCSATFGKNLKVADAFGRVALSAPPVILAMWQRCSAPTGQTPVSGLTTGARG
jgi:hypothetical protein